MVHFNRQDVYKKMCYSVHVTLKFLRDTKWLFPAYIEKIDNFENSQKMQYLLINCEARNYLLSMFLVSYNHIDVAF